MKRVETEGEENLFFRMFEEGRKACRCIAKMELDNAEEDILHKLRMV